MNKLLKNLSLILLRDSKTGQLSHTKLWSNVGYACLCFTFVYAVIYGSTVDVMIWALFGVVVIGNRTIVSLMNKTPLSTDETS